MRPEELRRRYLAGKRRALELRGRGREGSRLVELGRASAGVVAATPENPWYNLALAEHADGGTIAAVEAAYAEAGVRSWSIAALDGDDDSTRALEAAGYRVAQLDVCMALELDCLSAWDVPALELSTAWEPELLGRVNDRGFGSAEGAWLAAYRELPAEGMHPYLARLGGEPASVVATYDVGEDCVVWYVSTVPEARRRGLARALMLRALADARARGCVTSTLEATADGQPLYERLGYARVGELRLWRR